MFRLDRGSRGRSEARTRSGRVPWGKSLLLLGLAAIGLVLLASPARALATDDYFYKYAKDYNTALYEWWIDENNDGVPQAPGELVSPFGYYYRNCTDFAAYRLNGQKGGSPTDIKLMLDGSKFANAITWRQATVDTYGADKVNGIAAVGAVAWWEKQAPIKDKTTGQVVGYYGHVAIVASANSDGSVDIEEYNYQSQSNNFQIGVYGTRHLTKNEQPDAYLHIADVATAPKGSAPASSAIAFVFDVSNSMDSTFNGEVKLDEAKSAGHDVVTVTRNLAKAGVGNSQVAIAAFSDDASRVRDLTTDLTAVDQAINNLTTSDMTNLGAGLETGLAQLEAAAVGTTKALVLLSDGMTNVGMAADEVLAGPVQEAKAAGVKIYTVGFGEAGDLDEDLLRSIATETGGQYRLADSTAVKNSLASVLMRSQVASTQNILAEFEGTVAQGVLAKAGTFLVDKLDGFLQVLLYWPGSELEIRLTDPSGTQITAGYPGLTLSQTRPLQAIITDPAAGEWGLSVYGKQVSATSESYYALVSCQTTTTTLAPEPPKTSPPSPGRGVTNDRSTLWLGVLGLVLLGGIIWIVLANRRSPKKTTDAFGSSATPPGESHTAQPSAVAVLIRENGTRFDLHLGTNTVGRASRNDVAIVEERTSRSHAEVVVGPDGTLVRDLDSAYGTHVNDEQILGERTLRDGDRVTFGGTTFVFRSTPVTS